MKYNHYVLSIYYVFSEADDTMSRNTPKEKNIEEVMGAAESGVRKLKCKALTELYA